MHPDVMREMARQRVAERHEAARKAGVGRALRKAMRAQRGRAKAPDTFVAPAIPDYVDGTFSDAQHEVPAERASAGS